MKSKLGILLLVAIISISPILAQDVTTVDAKSEEISDNLDLEAVASVFGESKDLEDFEKRLNDPETQITNLDLNEDGEVDYLRVVETSEGETHLIAIQAVIGKDQYQDVATVEVEKDKDGETQVQVVGDVYMYGENYIVEPVYVQPPIVITFFWGPYYNPWYSPYYYGYYPPYYRPWRPYPPHRYQRNVHVHVNVNNSYNYTSVRKSKTSVNLHNKNRRNDFGEKNPDKSFSDRNKGVSNKHNLNQNRKSDNVTKPKSSQVEKSTGKKVQEDWKPASEKANDSKVDNKKKSKTSDIPNSKSGQKSTEKINKPSKQQKPASKPVKQSKPKTKKRKI